MSEAITKIKKPNNPILATRILLNWLIIMYLFQIVLMNNVGQEYIQVFRLWNEGVWGGQWYRLFTYSVVHGAWWHFLLNAGALLGVGYCMETKMRGRWVFLVFVAGTLGGGLVSLFLNPLGLIGASPGIFAMCGAFFLYVLKNGDWAEKSIWGLALVADVALSFYPQFDLYAHLGGLATGLTVGVLLFWILKTK